VAERGRSGPRLPTAAARVAAQRDQNPLRVLYEDNHLLVVAKPAGLLSQGDRTGDTTVLDLAAEYLRRRYHKPGKVYLGLVHRLDRPVSGVLVLARTSKAARRITAQIKSRSVEKRYSVVVEGRLREAAGRLEHYLVKRGEARRVGVFGQPVPNGRRAELEYEVIETCPTATLLDVRLLTGRSHQIRAQLAAIGHPILRDRRYGSSLPPGAGGWFALHAANFTLEHPTLGERMTFSAPLPEQWPWPPPPGMRPPDRRRAPRSEIAKGPSIRDGVRSHAATAKQAPLNAAHGDGKSAEIIHLDEHLVAVNKPAGLPVQATRDPRREHLFAAVERALPPVSGKRRLALMTRLPVAASGIVLLARTRSGARSVEAQLKRRALRRLFVLVVRGAREGGPRLPAPEAWRPEAGVGAVALGPLRRGAALLLVEPRRAPLRALEEMLRTRHWQVVAPARGVELRHLHRVRMAQGDPQPLELVAPLPAGFQPWLPDPAALDFAPAEHDRDPLTGP